MSAMRPGRKTALLATGLALLSAGLIAGLDKPPVLSPPAGLPSGAVVVGLGVLFLVAELCLLHVEVRREAYSITLAGVPLVLGLLLCDPRQLVLARLVGSAAAFAAQRCSPIKAGYNLAAYAFETAVDVLLLHALAGSSPDLTVSVALLGYLVVVLVDQVMSGLVTSIIGWHQGRLTAGQRAEVHVPALICSALATTLAYGLLLLASHGAVGAFVVSIFTGATALVYRAFQTLHRRHQALSSLHAFVGLNDGDAPLVELSGRMLEQVRALMRAARAELALTDPDDPLQLVVEEDGLPRRTDPHPMRRAQDLTGGRSAEPAGGSRPWTFRKAKRQAISVLLPGPSDTSLGTLTVVDRLGDTGAFTGEDETLLQTLAGHLAVAVSSSRRRDQLRYDASHDALTDLGNRALLSEAMWTQLPVGPGREAVVIVLDLDRFKEVNDTLGHHVGDALLIEVAQRLRRELPADATIARLGGDEFAALIPDLAGMAVDPGARTAMERAEAVANRLTAALALPFELTEATLTTRASVGVTLASPESTPSDLLRRADIAMYAAKEDALGVVVYSEELDRERSERLALLADLHLALEHSELTVVYQPKLDLTLGRITSVEALVRWNHPRLGPLSPATFIPLAESNGLIAPLTEVVLAEALAQCAAWRAEGLDLAVAVNLSARTVNDPGLPEQISAALLAAGVPATSLILEVTESAIMDDPQGAVTILDRIVAIGVSLSLDDFGTGYSSLSYLQQLPVREVKIDRSFISKLTGEDPRSQVLVRSIINLTRSLGLRVIAEGVENAETLVLLQELGCHLVQGYHISRPLPAADLGSILRQTRALPRPRAVSA
jgi:diguanylate cyclase (GGDEF)-like protein